MGYLGLAILYVFANITISKLEKEKFDE